MEYTAMTLFRLVTASLVPVVLSVAFFLLEKHTAFGKRPSWQKQTVTGIVFGIATIVATEFGIPVNGAVLNVRNAAPLSAGLIFGWRAGVVAGLIGGVERWFTPAGDFTRLACTLGTIVAGIIGACVRKFLMDNKKASWFYGLAVGITTEVLHMLLVFLTNIGELHRAFAVVKICAIPMIAANGISAMLSILVVSVLWRGTLRKPASTQENISQTFRRWLMLCVLLAFVATMLFTNTFQNKLAYATAEVTLRNNLEDVQADIKEASDRHLLAIAEQVKQELPENPKTSDLASLAVRHDLTEINIVGKDGIISASTHPAFEGFDMMSGSQSAEFMVLLHGIREYVQDYQPIASNPNISRKYAGVSLSNGGFLQVGYDAEHFQHQIDQEVRYAAQNRRIGQEGAILICNQQGTIISAKKGSHTGEMLDVEGLLDSGKREGVRFESELFGTGFFCMYLRTEGYYIIGIIPTEEATFSRDASVYILAFMETLVFSILFATIFVLIKKLVVENIQKINAALGQITNGNLDVTVDVRDNEEFACLSDDINSTVHTLKKFIEEAAARFDQDLEIAKRIQHSALPSVFPPYPNRKDFSIYASMDAAKEVGGDFYDFYLLDENRLAFVVADVSGKGIPAAMFMMTAKTYIQSFAESGLSVADIFTQTNQQLCEHNEAEMFVTAWMGILDLKTGVVKFANAGHNPPLVKHRDGSYAFLKSRVNLVLAGMEGIRYREQQLQLAPGDEIFLYTDGVTEAHNIHKELFGDDRLRESLNGAAGLRVEEICAKVKKDLHTFVGEASQFDDITMLCIHLTETEEAKMTVKPNMESVAEVAAFVEEQLEKMEVPMRLTTKLMISVDEIYSNIVRYSHANQAAITVSREENTIQLVFEDDGKPYNPLEAEEPDITASAEDRTIGGLGIFMVRKMMDQVDYSYHNGRNVLTLGMNVSET